MSCGATLAQSAERSSHNQYTERTQNRKKRYRKVARSKLAGRTTFFSFFFFFLSSDPIRGEHGGGHEARSRGSRRGEERGSAEGEILEEGSICSLLFDLFDLVPSSLFHCGRPPVSLGAAAISSSMRRVGEARNGKIKQKREGGRRKKTRDGEEKLRRSR